MEKEVNVIKLDEEFMKEFWEELEAMGMPVKELRECIQCGRCAGTCPMALAGLEYFIKRIVHASMLGLKEIFLDDSSVWGCQSCNRCVEVCPMDIKPYELIQAIRRVCFREYAMPSNTIDGLRNYYERGHAVIVKGFEERRKKVGLPEMPPTVIGNEEMRKKFQEVMKQTALAEVAPFPLD
ncbi:4Fe-4S dicluster domain-containing protein [Thermodesulfobacterium hveragerdense]|uniref:4Fe-4S dicluster domain-containing protein n=1 Tax=Thermodesulfobacterium hveragerdense TaxID=53424 RepID=UPI0003FE4BCE|nr:4Fe-4S dicluster domain-containing protein [Thermodesulfobacterium hveragerdense]